MAHPPALDPWSGVPHAPHPEAGAAVVRAPAHGLTRAVRALAAVGVRLLKWRTWRAPDNQLTPSRLDAHQALLVDAFAPLHDQAALTLKARGLTLLWSPGAGVSTLRLTADATQGLLLVAREALDQVQRQAQRPGQIRIELDLLHGETGSHLRMAVIDTGRAAACPTPQSPSQRHELSMAQRYATQLGAQFDISVDTTGWCAELVLQLAPA